MKSYRFFFHYRRNTNGMTVHFKGKCIPTKNVECKVPVETKYSYVQPRLILRGYCQEIIKHGDTIIIQ